MSATTLLTRSAAGTRAIGSTLARVLRAGDLILLSGGLGAGKTELAKGIGDGLGVEETVVSPTFTIAREYDAAIPLLHVDVYRLDRVQEVVDLALEERDDAVTVVEWGDAVSMALPADRLEIGLARPSDGGADERTVCIEACGDGWRHRWDEVRTALLETAATTDDLEAR